MNVSTCVWKERKRRTDMKQTERDFDRDVEVAVRNPRSSRVRKTKREKNKKRVRTETEKEKSRHLQSNGCNCQCVSLCHSRAAFLCFNSRWWEFHWHSCSTDRHNAQFCLTNSITESYLSRKHIWSTDVVITQCASRAAELVLNQNLWPVRFCDSKRKWTNWSYRQVRCYGSTEIISIHTIGTQFLLLQV